MNRVKELRIRAGMQQKELALTLGIAQPSVSSWERQKSDPTDENVIKLAQLFNVDESYIVYYSPIQANIATPERPRVSSLSDADIDAIAQRVKERAVPDDVDDDTWALRERYRRDPNYRLLFDAMEKAKPEHLRAAAAMLKALEGTSDD